MRFAAAPFSCSPSFAPPSARNARHAPVCRTSPYCQELSRTPRARSALYGSQKLREERISGGRSVTASATQGRSCLLSRGRKPPSIIPCRPLFRRHWSYNTYSVGVNDPVPDNDLPITYGLRVSQNLPAQTYQPGQAQTRLGGTTSTINGAYVDLAKVGPVDSTVPVNAKDAIVFEMTFDVKRASDGTSLPPIQDKECRATCWWRSPPLRTRNSMKASTRRAISLS